jgi:hypothetical protein
LPPISTQPDRSHQYVRVPEPHPRIGHCEHSHFAPANRQLSREHPLISHNTSVARKHTKNQQSPNHHNVSSEQRQNGGNGQPDHESRPDLKHLANEAPTTTPAAPPSTQALDRSGGFIRPSPNTI